LFGYQQSQLTFQIFLKKTQHITVLYTTNEGSNMLKARTFSNPAKKTNTSRQEEQVTFLALDIVAFLLSI